LLADSQAAWQAALKPLLATPAGGSETLADLAGSSKTLLADPADGSETSLAAPPQSATGTQPAAARPRHACAAAGDFVSCASSFVHQSSSS